MFSLRLKLLRKEHNLTQEELANIISVERSSIGKYESQKSNVIPSPEVLSRIANCLDVSVDYLLGRTDVKKPNSTDNRDIKAALFGGDTEVTDEMWDEVKKFAEYIKHKNNK